MKRLKQVWATLVLSFLVAVAAVFTPLYLLTVGIVAGVKAIKDQEGYGLEVWFGYDKFLNAVFKGSHEETISSRLGKSTLYGYPPVFNWIFVDKFIASLLNQVDKNHCEKAIKWRSGEQTTQRTRKQSLGD